MKVYLIAHTGALHPFKMCGWVVTVNIPPNSFFVKSVRAFLRKKDAKEFLAENKWKNYRVVTAELKG
jgi:hypothetical protein